MVAVTPSCHTWGGNLRCDLDLDEYPRVQQAYLHHGGGRRGFGEVAAENRPAGREIIAIGQQIAHPHHVGHPRTCRRQRGLHIAQGLLGLSLDASGQRHRRVVEAGTARDEDPIAVDNGTGVTDLGFEGGA